jgi:hypothetical protein
MLSKYVPPLQTRMQRRAESNDQQRRAKERVVAVPLVSAGHLQASCPFMLVSSDASRPSRALGIEREPGALSGPDAETLACHAVDLAKRRATGSLPTFRRRVQHVLTGKPCY